MESRRVLCVVHCFYPEFVRELADCVANVTEPHDVVVTYSAASSGMRPLNAIQVRELPAAAPTAKPTAIFVH